MNYQLRPFDGDFARLASLIQSSWAANAEQPLLYTPEHLASLYRYPGFDLRFSPSYYSDNELVASLTSQPRKLSFKGETFRVQANSLLTVAPSHRSAALGISLWTEHCRHGRESGSDGTIGYCVEGDSWNRVFLTMAKALKVPSWKIFSIQYMAKYFRPGKESYSHTRSPMSRDEKVSSFLQAAQLVPITTNSLVRRWSAEEASWQVIDRDASLTAALRVGPRVGAISGYIMQTMGTTSVKCALIDDLLFGDLEPNETLALMDEFLGMCQEMEVQLVLAPLLGYYTTRVLEERAFRKTRRLLHCYYSSWTGRGPAGPVDSMYLDVF